MTMITATAPAKTILFGEHAVVYGYPAIAIPISSHTATATVVQNTERLSGIHIIAPDIAKVLKIETLQPDQLDDALSLTVYLVLQHFKITQQPPLDITVRSNIPPASGLGSGAAVSTAIAKALIKALEQSITIEALNQLVFEVEKIHHGTPSGIDNTVIVYEQPIYYVRNQPIELLTINQPFALLIADTGCPAPTKIAVDDVRKLYNKDYAGIHPFLENIGNICIQGKQALEDGNTIKLGDLMNQNHKLLRQLTVSSEELDNLVDGAMQAGALGAKLSGGGRGGNMIALIKDEQEQIVMSALKQAGAAQVFKLLLPSKSSE